MGVFDDDSTAGRRRGVRELRLVVDDEEVAERTVNQVEPDVGRELLHVVAVLHQRVEEHVRAERIAHSQVGQRRRKGGLGQLQRDVADLHPEVEQHPVSGPVEQADLRGALAAAPEVTDREPPRAGQRLRVVAFVHEQVLRPFVASNGNRHPRVDHERLADGLDARLDGVLGEGTSVQRDLQRGVCVARDQFPAWIVVTEHARVRLQLPDATLAQRFWLRQEGDVEEATRDADPPHEADVVLEALANGHDRHAHARQAVFPANRHLG